MQEEPRTPRTKLLTNRQILERAKTNIFGSSQKAILFRNKYGAKAFGSILRAHLEQIKEFTQGAMKLSRNKRSLKPKNVEVNPRAEWLHEEKPGGERFVGAFENAMAMHSAAKQIILQSSNPWKTAEAIWHHGARELAYRLKPGQKTRVIDILAELATKEDDIPHIGNILHEGAESNPENYMPEGVNGLIYLVADEKKATPHQWLKLIRLAKQKGISLKRVRSHAHDSGVESALEALNNRRDKQG